MCKCECFFFFFLKERRIYNIRRCENEVRKEVCHVRKKI